LAPVTYLPKCETGVDALTGELDTVDGACCALRGGSVEAVSDEDLPDDAGGPGQEVGRLFAVGTPSADREP